MEAVVLEKTSRKEWSRWHEARELIRCFGLGLCTPAGCSSLLPESQVGLSIFSGIANIHTAVAVEEAHTAQEVSE